MLDNCYASFEFRLNFFLELYSLVIIFNGGLESSGSHTGRKPSNLDPEVFEYASGALLEGFGLAELLVFTDKDFIQDEGGVLNCSVILLLFCACRRESSSAFIYEKALNLILGAHILGPHKQIVCIVEVAKLLLLAIQDIASIDLASSGKDL